MDAGFSRYFSPIREFLSTRNPFSRRYDNERWLGQERAISKRLGFNAACALAVEGVAGVPPDAELVVSLSSHPACDTPRRGFEGVSRLLERIEETARSPSEFSAAMLEYFGFLHSIVLPYAEAEKRFSQAINGPGIAFSAGAAFTDAEVYDETGLNRTYFCLYMNQLMIHCALSPSFDVDAFERMALTWVTLPESVARYNKALFTGLQQDSVFMRTVTRHLADLQSGDPERVSGARAWFEAFPLKQAG